MKKFLLFFIIVLFGCSAKDNDVVKIFGKITDKEPNNLIKNCNLVANDTTIVGFFDVENKDKDVYKVSSLIKNVSYEIIVSGVPCVDFKMSFFDENQKLILSVDEEGKGEGERLWEFRNSNNYFYIIIESKNGFNKKVPYVLNFIKKQENATEEKEPNNSEKDAIEIHLNETKKAFLSPQNDIDYYKIVFNDNLSYDFSVEIETFSNIDINFILINKKNQISKVINKPVWGSGEIFQGLNSKKGEYIVKVSGKVDEENKKDTIYYISIKEMPKEKENTYFEQEFNDDFQDSTELINQGEFIGSFFPENDNDFYKFDLYKKPISVDFSISRVKGVDPIVELYDEKKNLIKTINNNGKDNSEQSSFSNLDVGKYYLKVYAKESSLLLYNLYFYIRYE
ncbi:MAG: hypothetical protein A2086_00195 [Spirochaetes bacterium GWD1_27_9]|nr:MAG: hypothetical protein A2Z98_04160 [Spirochaetes bacterium GWB1_27_13]OHD20017.1 MAG: hypothetical protein A2Y34_08175 [Spirochaetes bacterium GWC1_27_15]OHD30492.1 MAG: hypothetical protein A2086_00195 [Spirochaetes bacterium GWD1_27_9]